MKDLLRSFVAGMAKWKIYIGRALDSVPAGSIVLFPLRPGVLHCGIAGIVAVKASGIEPAPSLDDLLETFKTGDPFAPGTLDRMERSLLALKQDSGLQFALHREGRLESLRGDADRLKHQMAARESALESGSALSSREIEQVSRHLLQFKDVIWGLEEDLLRNQGKILETGGTGCLSSIPAFQTHQRLNLLLNAIDRLEVRGRDSAGVEMILKYANPEAAAQAVDALMSAGLYLEFEERQLPGDLGHRSIRRQGASITFTWKTASVVGELGRNCRELRKAIRADAVFHQLAAAGPVAADCLGHTRWASVGAINITNCHPVNNHALEENGAKADSLRTYPGYGTGPWTIDAVLNGDIDNYASLLSGLETAGVRIDPLVTTDTKVIPLQIERHLRSGSDLLESFRRAVCSFEGSHAIAMRSNLEPGRTYLALRGSGQALFVGLAQNHHIFASEVYGLVEETPEFLAMNGDSPRNQADPSTRGQIFVLRDDLAHLRGIEAFHYDGFPLRLAPSIVRRAEITTRDIDRGNYPHFLLKEINDAPLSIRKTLRGKYQITGQDGGEAVRFNLGHEVVPERIGESLSRGEIRRIFVIGQGTAAIAGSAIAEALSIYLSGAPIQIQARKASELSGFATPAELKDALVIAVTQSGTTTDTNRAVTMACEAGAQVIAIVNRRQSDITGRAHGVFYTSDGRDIEMSVASTKAFYAQIVAGFILALYFAQRMGTLTDERIARELASLRRAPRLMGSVIERRDALRKAAWDLAREKKYWAVVGNGANKVAADEVRIKLSELCYKTISSDFIEDKKHIDLSAEPLILVLAAGCPEIVTGDIVKDTAIFKAHAARVVVVTDEGEERFAAVADRVIQVPRAPFPVSVILNTLAGHLFGYYAALSLDDQAQRFRDFRSRIADTLAGHSARGYSIYESVQDREMKRVVEELSGVLAGWRSKGQLASLNSDTAADLVLLLKYASGKLPLEDFRADFSERAHQSPLEALLHCLGRAVDELGRPVDAIRHQAKTVTVGTSRKVESLHGILFDPIFALGFTSDNLKAKEVFTLKRLQAAVSAVRGYTMYRIRGLDEDGNPADASAIFIDRRGGCAEAMASRVDKGGPLLGTKRTIVRTGEVYAGTGRSDGAPIIIVPLMGAQTMIEQLLLLHVDYRNDLTAAAKKEILGLKAVDIQNLLNESNLPWSDDRLQALPMAMLLGEAPEVIAEVIRRDMTAGLHTN
jgi:glutamine---fructose-6-phosphate transaminase (isomerizing)